MDKIRFALLFNKYLTGTLSDTEQHEFDMMMVSMDEDEFLELVDEHIQLKENRDFGRDDVFAEIVGKTEGLGIEETGVVRPLFKKWKQWYRIAAVFLITGLLGLVLFQMWGGDGQDNHLVEGDPKINQRDMELPDEQALITLADGKQLSLSDFGDDTLRFTGVTLSRSEDGTIIMEQDKNLENFAVDKKHRFKTPKGGTLRLVLPDASIVYLNSDSEIQIYTSFGKKQRGVDLSGEAFFEVAHDKNLPFVVQAKNAAVTVLGTQFNMSAYKSDRGVSTTLLSGAVQVDAANSSVFIKPGQQANVDASARIQLEEKVDMDRIMAWRSGYFQFKDESIRNIMADLAKWYPIEDVEFMGGATDRFTGSLKRSKKLSDVLANIEQVSDLRFDIQEGRVIVMK